MRARPHNFKAMIGGLENISHDENGPLLPRELDRSWVTVLEDLGRGNFGVVSKGIFEEKVFGIMLFWH